MFESALEHIGRNVYAGVQQLGALFISMMVTVSEAAVTASILLLSQGGQLVVAIGALVAVGAIYVAVYLLSVLMDVRVVGRILGKSERISRAGTRPRITAHTWASRVFERSDSCAHVLFTARDRARGIATLVVRTPMWPAVPFALAYVIYWKQVSPPVASGLLAAACTSLVVGVAAIVLWVSGPDAPQAVRDARDRLGGVVAALRVKEAD